jgi:hypothetical protein
VKSFYRVAVAAFGFTFVALGIALLVVTAVHGGGAVGFLLGVLFIAAGVGRLYLLSRGT